MTLSEINEAQFDAIIMGGGPAGAAAAAVMAEAGDRVLVLERDRFPRYHVGESLLPFTYYPLKRLGLIDRMRRSAFVKKHSVQFVAPSGKASQPFYFATRYNEEVAQTWQVLRSEFDVLLRDNAVERGALFLEGAAVTEFLKRDEDVIGVAARDQEGRESRVYAPITIDCTGRDAFSAVRRRWRVGDPELHKAAVWTYYKGAARDPGIDAGATTVAFIPERGWFWYIPLHDDRVSVGVVAEGKYLSRDGVKDPEAIFRREIEENAWIKSHLAPGRQEGPFFITGEYSYHAKHCAAPGLLLAGDAFCFLDPVFSSGLMLALKSGVMAGEAVHEAIAANDFSPARFADYGASLRLGIENMRKLIYAFYNPDFSFRVLTDKYPHLSGDITDCLSGDVNKDFSQLFEAIAEFAEVPDALPYGGPLELSASS